MVKIQLSGGPLDGATFALPAHPTSITFADEDTPSVTYTVDGPPSDRVATLVVLHDDRHRRDPWTLSPGTDVPRPLHYIDVADGGRDDLLPGRWLARTNWLPGADCAYGPDRAGAIANLRELLRTRYPNAAWIARVPVWDEPRHP